MHANVKIKPILDFIKKISFKFYQELPKSLIPVSKLFQLTMLGFHIVLSEREAFYGVQIIPSALLSKKA